MDYNPKFLDNIHIWSKEELEILHKMKEDMPIEVFLNSTGDKGLVEAYGFDFIYTSAKIEGNTYDRYETLDLLDMGITAGGKKYSDALMILNLKEVYRSILNINYPINKNTLKEIHSIIAKDLVQRQNLGSMRKIDVQIGGSTYKPLSTGDRLNAELDYLFKIYQTIDNPFNKALYIHHNLAYLQYFEDCNKRTARTMQFISFKNDGIMPFIITNYEDSVYSQYRRTLVSYYEKGDYEPYKEFFMQNYKKIHQDLLRWQGIGIERDKPFKHTIPQTKPKEISKKQSESIPKPQTKTKARRR
ncbi:Fic family protein [Helicobacter cappadocius]|uniref:Fic family protein n=1 Tax=Helicobacter cappadocius TaxID=3063998 RepID=A0AA90TCK9_9HELI|nr:MULTISPECIES: Fic family protein [unclassified Helicobacter]MDO7253922.1 Fic family protein [Helicobacter sp. faydin-H75]MDP2539781.1 Fic family protein [Helicobacter sp. faydin-H76]